MLASFVLDHVSVDFVNTRFEYRWNNAAPHVMVYGPRTEEPLLPTAADVADAIAALPDRQLSARPPTAVLDGDLMEAPAAVMETSTSPGLDYPDVFVDSTQLNFANGVTVILNATPIESNQVTLTARSNGGLAEASPDDIIDGHVAADVVTSSGIGEFNQSQLNQLLAGSTAELQPVIGETSDEMFGNSATTDLEDLLALTHLYMTDPNFDPVALDRVLTRRGPTRPIRSPTSTRPDSTH